MGLGFYDYDKKIVAKIKDMGYSIDYINSKIRYNLVEDFIDKYLIKGYKKRKQFLYEKRILEKYLERYDIVFIIDGGMDAELLKGFRKRLKDSVFILYLWDDVVRIKNFESTRKCFDKIFSFSQFDAHKYGLTYLPLFYLNEFRYAGEEKRIAMNMIGTLQEERLSIGQRVREELKLTVQMCFIYLYERRKWHYLIRNHILKMNLKNIPQEIYFDKISIDNVAQILKNSKITLDIPAQTQKGLSMRTFESIAAHTKIITTNPGIRSIEFYNSSNVCVIDKDNINISSDFLKRDYVPLDDSVIEKYSFDNWMKAIFGG